MATKVQCVVITRWKVSQWANDPAILDDLQFPGVAVSDLVNLPDDRLPPKPNLHIVEVDGLTPAQLTALNARNNYQVLMTRFYDDQTGAEISSTYDDTPTTGALNALAAQLKVRFTDIDDDKISRGGRAIFRSGLTRRQILDELIQRWRSLEVDPAARKGN